VAGKPKAPAQTRREAIEAMRRQQHNSERRKTMAFVALAIIVGLGLIAAVAVPQYLDARDDPTKKAMASFGVPVAQAGCDPVIEDTAISGGEASHVAEGERVNYPMVPPSNGKHDGAWIPSPRPFYTADDRPSIEKLVHSLEHGHTILWYDSTVTGDQLKAIEDLAERARKLPETRDHFIAAPLDEARGKLPEGKHIALSHWGAAPQAQAGQPAPPGKAYRQLCGGVSGEVVEQFVKAHPWSDAPEPGAA
jgi:hypothetical protein